MLTFLNHFCLYFVQNERTAAEALAKAESLASRANQQAERALSSITDHTESLGERIASMQSQIRQENDAWTAKHDTLGKTIAELKKSIGGIESTISKETDPIWAEMERVRNAAEESAREVRGRQGGNANINCIFTHANFSPKKKKKKKKKKSFQ